VRGHAVRGMVTAWLGLIVLQTVGTTGSGQVAGAFADVNRLVKRALDPSVAAIPDRRAGAPGAGGSVASGAAAAAHSYSPRIGPVANGAAAVATPPYFPR
jgi:hypothetical protein